MSKLLGPKPRRRPGSSCSGSQRRRPAEDPTTAYARAVARNRRVAGKPVRLAAQRHLRDLKRQRTQDFPYHFEAALAEHVFHFFQDVLLLEAIDHHGRPRPFRLEPWQQFIVGSLFGWVDAQGARRFRTAYVEVGKGNGKTPLAAGIGLYGLLYDGEPAAEIYAAAVTADQASICFRDAQRFVDRSPDLRDWVDRREHNLAVLDTQSYFRAVSSEHRGLDGKRVHMALIDELHEHPSGIVVDKMRAGTKGRRQALIFEITNSGYDRTSVCWQHHEYSLKVLEQSLPNETWFAYISALDQGDKWTDPRVWVKANPNLGISITEQYLREQIREAQDMPTKANIVKRLNLCLWTQQHTIWLPTDEWDACRVPELSDGNPQRLLCTAGIDLSTKLDLTAIVLVVQQPDDGAQAPASLEVQERDTTSGEWVKRTLNIDYRVELVPFFWLPEHTLDERVRSERIPFDVWRAAGHLRVTPGDVVDYDAIYDEFVGRIVPQWAVQKVGYDPWNATQFATALKDRARLDLVELGQGKKLSEALKLLRALVRSRRLSHDGHPVLAWCASNAQAQEDRYTNIWLTKPSETQRIDGIVAAAMALDLLIRQAPTRSVYEERELLIL